MMKWLITPVNSSFPITPLTCIATLLNLFLVLYLPWAMEDSLPLIILMCLGVAMLNFGVHEIFKERKDS